MRLKKTKLAGLISLLLCSPAMAATETTIFEGQSDTSRFGPFISAMSADAGTIATYTQTYAQPFWFDIGAPWTFNNYCVYDSNICEMLWDGSSNSSDGLQVWRANILSTHNGKNGTYKSETSSKVDTIDVTKRGTLDSSIKVTAVNGNDKAGYGTLAGPVAGSATRRGFFNDTELKPAFDTYGGFSTAHDFVEVSASDADNSAVIYTSRLAVGQASVKLSNPIYAFTYCFDFSIDDDRGDYDDLYNCPGFDLQASYWAIPQSVSAPVIATSFVGNWIDTGGDATYIANAYAMNTSGFAVGFSTEQIYSTESGGRARATIYKPNVAGSVAVPTISYGMTQITRPKTDVGGDYNSILRDTVAIDITDTVYDSASQIFGPADGTDKSDQAFVVVGNRTYDSAQNGNDAIEFFVYDNSADTSVRYPFKDSPIKGANSQVSKINNDGLAIGWRDARGATGITNSGSPRFQSAFIYDYKTGSSAYLDDIYCKTELKEGREVKYRLTNAISISDDTSGSESGEYTIIANGYDYKNQTNYTNKTGSTPAVFKMTIDASDLASLPKTSQCPIKEDQDYERQGASMNWFILLPMMMLFFRRFKR